VAKYNRRAKQYEEQLINKKAKEEDKKRRDNP
jgi:hypothetical protein